MKLTELQLDTLKELINMGVGKAAGVMNEMLQMPMDLAVPSVRIVMPEELDSLGHVPLATVSQGFHGPFDGTASLVFPPESASALVNALTGQEVQGVDLDEIRTGTVTEVGNMVLNGVMGAIVNVLQRHIDYHVPIYQECNLEELLIKHADGDKRICLYAETKFSTKELQIEGSVYLLFEVGSFHVLMEALDALIPTS